MREAVVFLLAALACAASAAAQPRAADARAYTEEREPCRDYRPLNKVHWGDLHVHTKWSLDAATQATRTTPAQSYDFAKGTSIGIQPWVQGDFQLEAQRRLQLARPLDFAAVTDHAELLGEVNICTNPELDGHDSWACRAYRWFPRLAFFMFNAKGTAGHRLGFCGEDGALCREAGAGPWREIQDAAEDAYDRSAACRFTSFVGYEWTGTAENDGNIHRNVIFRNAEVPRLPFGVTETGISTTSLHWTLLDECITADGRCDVLVIPHNSNLSNGAMFERAPRAAEDTYLRARFETLVELLQHKGSSECFYGAGYGLGAGPGLGIGEDELCAFEQLPYNTFAGKFQRWSREPPQADDGFMRSALRKGLREERRVGENPFKTGFIGSTDTHLGTPGAVNEADFPGHGGAGKPANEMPPGLPDDVEFNPGGLAAVWAPENSRDALFEAMRRRETYATSGPRIELRFFGGSALRPGLCERADWIEQAYQQGVPMGGTLYAPPGGRYTEDGPVEPEDALEVKGIPRFAVAARRDPGGSLFDGAAPEPSGLLQRLQIIKGWIGEDGAAHEKVYDIAGDADNGAGVDISSCAPYGDGFDELCAVWKDPDYNPAESVYYYARAVENPSCRWSQRICAARAVNCSDPGAVGEGLEGCCAESHRPIIQERAVSSPIWHRGKPATRWE